MKKLINYLLENKDTDQHDDPESNMITKDDGTIEYRHKKTGKLHNKFGWAKYSNRSKLWFINGKLHREGNPAVIYFNGSKEWYLNDIRYSENEYYTRMFKNYKKTKLPEIKKFIINNLWILKYFKKLPKELQEFENEYYQAKLGYYDYEKTN
jgi:hypothetical protein